MNILPFHLAFCVWIHHNTWSRIEVLMDRRVLSGESNHHDARLNGRGQKVAENTKHSRNIQRTLKIIKLDTETHVLFEGKSADCHVGG